MCVDGVIRILPLLPKLISITIFVSQCFNNQAFANQTQFLSNINRCCTLRTNVAPRSEACAWYCVLVFVCWMHRKRYLTLRASARRDWQGTVGICKINIYIYIGLIAGISLNPDLFCLKVWWYHIGCRSGLGRPGGRGVGPGGSGAGDRGKGVQNHVPLPYDCSQNHPNPYDLLKVMVLPGDAASTPTFGQCLWRPAGAPRKRTGRL